MEYDVRKAISENILHYRKKANMSQKELAAKINANVSSISSWEKNLYSPYIDTLVQMCEVFNISLADMFGRDTVPEDHYTTVEKKLINKYRAIPSDSQKRIDLILDFDYSLIEEKKPLPTDPVPAPENLPVIEPVTEPEIDAYEDEDEEDIVEFPYSILPASAGLGNYLDGSCWESIDLKASEIPEGANFCLKISGDSMEPEYYDGDIVFVHGTPSIENGQIGIFVLNGESYCKKLEIDHKEREVRLVSLNKLYEPRVIGEYDDLVTIGRVIGVKA